MKKREDDPETRTVFGTVPKRLFDTPNRALTPEEKADPMTFFGVTHEMRQERLKKLEQLPPRRPKQRP